MEVSLMPSYDWILETWAHPSRWREEWERLTAHHIIEGEYRANKSEPRLFTSLQSDIQRMSPLIWSPSPPWGWANNNSVRQGEEKAVNNGNVTLPGENTVQHSATNHNNSLSPYQLSYTRHNSHANITCSKQNGWGTYSNTGEYSNPNHKKNNNNNKKNLPNGTERSGTTRQRTGQGSD